MRLRILPPSLGRGMARTDCDGGAPLVGAQGKPRPAPTVRTDALTKYTVAQICCCICEINHLARSSISS